MKLVRSMKWASVAALAFGFFAVASLDSFGASKAAEAKKAMADFAAAKDAKAKAAALDEIGKIGQVQKSLVESALPDVKKSLTDSSAIVRKAAAQAYGRLDPDPAEAVPLLTKMLKEDKDEDVKMGVASGLAAMGPSAHEALSTVRDVIKIEKDKSKDGKMTKLQRELGDTARAITQMKKKM